MVRKTVPFNKADEKEQRHAKSEYRTQTYLDHPNITKYIDVEWRDDQASFYMEHFKEGGLDTLIDASGNGRYGNILHIIARSTISCYLYLAYYV